MSSLIRRYLISFDLSIFLLIRLHATVIVLNHELQVTYKYKCVVRIVAIYPCRAEDFRSPNGIYRVRVTLEDPTARIHAYIYKEDGVKCFTNDVLNCFLSVKHRSSLFNEDQKLRSMFLIIFIFLVHRLSFLRTVTLLMS